MCFFLQLIVKLAEDPLRFREAMLSFFPEAADESTMVTNRRSLLSSLHDKQRGAVGSLEYNGDPSMLGLGLTLCLPDSFVSRNLNKETNKKWSAKFAQFCADWVDNLPGCFLDEMCKVTFQVSKTKFSFLLGMTEFSIPGSILCRW